MINSPCLLHQKYIIHQFECQNNFSRRKEQNLDNGQLTIFVITSAIRLPIRVNKTKREHQGVEQISRLKIHMLTHDIKAIKRQTDTIIDPYTI